MKTSAVLFWLLVPSFALVDSKSLMEGIVQSFKDRGPVYCFAILLERGKNSRDSIVHSRGIDVPSYILDMEGSMKNLKSLKSISSTCKHHVLILEKISSVEKIPTDYLTLSTSKFAIIIDEPASTQEIETVLENSSTSSLFNVVDLAIFVASANKKSTVYGRNPLNEGQIIILNFWTEGQFLWEDKAVFPQARLKNFAGANLRATSFQYPPFCYKDNPKDETEEYTGLEVRIFRDVSSTLNFTFDIQNPTDGGLWGEILKNGTATGLVGDVKVCIRCIHK